MKICLQIAVSIFFTLFVFDSQTFAQKTVQSPEEIRAALQSALSAANAVVISNQPIYNSAKKQYDDIKAEHDRLEGVFKQKQAAYDASAGGFFGIGRGTGDSARKKEMDDAEAASDALQSQLNLAESQLTSARNNLSTANTKVTTINTEANTKLTSFATAQKGFQGQLNINNLLSDFNSLEKKNLSLRSRLDTLSMKMDLSTLGTYLEDKIGKTLGSQAFCNAAGSCIQDHKRYKTKFEDIKEIFPTVSKDNVGFPSGNGSSNGTK